MSKEGERDGRTADELFGGTVMMESAPEPVTTGFDGTVMLEDASGLAPAGLTPDGTTMLDAASNPAAQLPEHGPTAAAEGTLVSQADLGSPALRRADDTRLPPSLAPTPAPPQAADLTFEGTGSGAYELSHVPPSPTPAPMQASSMRAEASQVPTGAAPRNPVWRAQRTLERRLDVVPGAKREARDRKTGGAKRSSKSDGGRKKGSRKKATASVRVPFWAVLLALALIASVLGYLLARL